MDSSSLIVGIDLGTTNSLLAVVEAGLPYVLADRNHRHLTPSVVHFGSATSPPLVGVEAARMRALKPTETLTSIKRFMGRRYAELTDEDKKTAYPLGKSESGQVIVPLHGLEYTPEDVSSHILSKLKSDAEAALGHSVKRAVITVPAYFNDAQRQATKRAGELSGLIVERIINEPTAAALAYGLHQSGNHSKFAVYDLGGGTFDISILEMNEGTFQVLSTHGNTRLGGDDLDVKITDALIHEIETRHPDLKPLSQHPGLKERIRATAEKAKCDLSELESVEISLPFLTPTVSYSATLTRQRLESLTGSIIDQTRRHCIQALADAKLEAKDLTSVILVGGQTRMPLVRRKIKEWFGKEPDTSIHPDEAVALGAAIQGSILSGGFQKMLLLDVTPLSLGIETFGGLMNVIIPRNSTIPIKAGEMFTTAVDNQPSVLIHVLQGERELAKDNWSLGKFDLPFPNAPKGIPRIGVQFEIDANGILHVLARDTSTGTEKKVEMKSAVDVTDEAVEKMIEESVDHAFEDMNARKWIEARKKATEMLKGARSALDAVGEGLPQEEKSKVISTMNLLENALLTENPATRSGDLHRLQKTMAKLDEVTQDLATMMLEKLMGS